MSLLKIVPLSEAGKVLRDIRREAKGFSNQFEVAEKMGINAVTLRKLESDGNFTKEQLIDYCRAIGIGEPFIIFAIDEEDVKRLLKSEM